MRGSESSIIQYEGLIILPLETETGCEFWNENCRENQYFTGILAVIFKPNHDFLFCSGLKDSQQARSSGKTIF